MNTKPKPLGRPRLEQEPQHKRTVTLSDRLIEIAKQIGGGNVSKGLRRALESFKQTKEGK